MYIYNIYIFICILCMMCFHLSFLRKYIEIILSSKKTPVCQGKDRPIDPRARQDQDHGHPPMAEKLMEIADLVLKPFF